MKDTNVQLYLAVCTIYSGCKVTFIIIHLLAVYQNVWCRPALPVKYFMSNKL